ncbi:RNA polymerase sigma factor [Microbacterium resistens]|uniref:RNA polymerase sigma factor n=1 Tax=Microbacterium resistens TaxID=156977 RepID=UPI0008349605|nr:sigma-70 family RNA polymerase sigma factor [Microbacterium resistens]
MTEVDDRLSLSEADDRTVAGRAADGDTEAFAVLVRRFAPRMRAYTRRLMGSTADVDDIVQEAFVTAWQRMDELTDPGAVKSWLMRIVSRRAIDRLRATPAHVDIDGIETPAPAHDSPARVVETRAELDALTAALAQLPEAQRRCWTLRELGGFSYDEIAEELDVPVSTVRGLLARARKDIIVRMEGWR